MPSLLIQNATLIDGAVTDVLAIDGVIVRTETALAAPAGAVVIDAHRRLLLPGFVDLHTHLDKTFCDIDNHSGTLREAIDIWLAATHLHTRESVYKRARRALERAISHGTTAMRSHVDVVTRQQLGSVEALLTLRDEFRDRISLQLVALGHLATSRAERDTVVEAIRMGVDFVGGAPALEPDPAASVRAAFEIAAETGAAIDLHIDETEDPQSRTLELLAELAQASGMHGRVTAGHCVSLAFMDETSAGRIIAACANAGVAVVTLPSCNLNLIGRGMQPAPRGLTRVKQLLGQGVHVVAASDNVRDPFNPFGDYNMLHTANLCAHSAHMSGVRELRTVLDMVTSSTCVAVLCRAHCARRPRRLCVARY